MKGFNAQGLAALLLVMSMMLIPGGCGKKEIPESGDMNSMSMAVVTPSGHTAASPPPAPLPSPRASEDLIQMRTDPEPTPQSIAASPVPTAAATGRKPAPTTFGSAVSTTLKEQLRKSKARHIDLVFCLDTSGSMNSLIDAAREKLQGIAREMKGWKPSPDLRVALIVYGSPAFGAAGGWVVVGSDFTGDLDSINQKLSAIRCSGGTEYVARAVKTALEQLSWSDGPDTLRTIFVAGNEDINQDRQFRIDDVCMQAVQNRTIINTIFCGRKNNFVANEWQRVAALGKGDFAAIELQPRRSGSTFPITLPPASGTVNLPKISTKEGTITPFQGRIMGMFSGDTLLLLETAPSGGRNHMLRTNRSTRYSPRSWRPVSGETVLIYLAPSQPGEIYQMVSQK